MTFSIIIPAYNAATYLRQCLDSIFSQGFSDYEVIVIDDGSTDGTATLLEQYAAKHANLHVLTQPNQGMATARNHGLEVARGEYILFVDSDDWLCTNALGALAEAIEGEDIIGFGTRVVHDTADTDDVKAEKQDKVHDEAIENLPPSMVEPIKGWYYFNSYRLMTTPVHFVCIWQRTYRRAFLEENGLRFLDGLRRAEDDLFTTQAMLAARSIKTIGDCLYTYRVRQGSITRTQSQRLDDDSRRVQQLLVDTFIPMQNIDKRVIYQVLASNYITSISNNKNYRLTPEEWDAFHQVCVTPRHRRLYRLAKIHPSLLRFYMHIR